MPFVSFISDDHFLKCIETLYTKYEKAKEEFTVKDFYKNQIDPIKLLFDIEFLGQDPSDRVLAEINRKIDKTLNNAIGEFHEDLIGGINGFKKHPIGKGYDVSDESEVRLFADIKNKHNTVKGSNHKDLYQELESFIEDKPSAKAYWVQIIGDTGKSFNEQWKIPKHNKNNPNVYRITADKFYALLTGNQKAFSELCQALPKAITHFLQSKNIKPNASNTTVYQEILEKSVKNNVSFEVQLMNDTFEAYDGFPIK
jgi:hypothetical protein